MRRATRVILIVALLLVAVALVAVQAVLWSDYPRTLVVAQLRDALGLDVQADALTTGWLGGTVLQGLRVSLPLEDRPLLEAPVVRVSHASLLRLALTRDLGLRRLEVESPHVWVRQRSDGTWNLEEVARVIRARAGDGEDAGRAPSIPALRLTDASVSVEPQEREAVTLEGIEVAGEPRSRLQYRLRVAAPRVGEVEAAFSPAEPWQHEATFALQPDPAVVRVLTGDAGPELRADGAWRGSVDDGVVQGQLELSPLVAAGHRVAGPVSVRIEPDGPRLVLEPEGLTVTPRGSDETVRVVRGGVSYQPGADVELTRVVLSGFGFDMLINGAIEPRRQTGELRLAWRQALPFSEGRGLTQRGRGTLTLDRTRGQRRVELEATATGQVTPWGEIEASWRVEAQGPTWTSLAGTLDARRLALIREGSTYTLDGATATWAVADDRFRLLRMRLPEADAPRRLTAQGFYDLQSRRWELRTVATAFDLPGVPFTLDRFALDAAGDAQHADLTSISLAAGGVRVEAEGAYAFSGEEPLAATVRLTQLPIRLGDDETRRVSAENLFGVLRVRGSASPMRLRAQGELTARALRVRGDLLGDIAMQVEGRADPEQVRAVAVAPAWLGGRWRLEAAIDRGAERGEVEVIAEDLDLALVEAAFGEELGLTGLGELRVSIDVPQTDPGQFRATGEFAVSEVAATLPVTRLAADEVRGSLELDRDRLRVSDVRATLGEATLAAEATVPLAGGPIRVRARPENWPLAFDAIDAGLVASGEVEAVLEPQADRFRGSADLQTRWRFRDETVAELAIDAAGTPQRIELNRLAGMFLDGTIEGGGVIDLATLVNSDLTLSWTDVRPAAVAPAWERLGEVAGGVSGTLRVQHVDDPRALAPLRMTMELDARGASVRGLTLGDGSAVGYTDGARWVLERFDVAALGGELSLWGRVTPRDGEYFAFASASARDVDIEAISQALRPDEPPAVGRLTTELTMSLPLDDWRLAFGQGSIEVADADFGSIPLFGALYDLVNLRLGSYQPDGRGRSDVRIEQGYVIFPSLRYQNRGAQFNVALRIHDLWEGEASPISGYAVASQRLLPEVAFFGGVGEAIDVLQQDLTPHRIAGTLGEPRLVPEPLGTLGDVFGEVIGVPPRESGATEPPASGDRSPSSAID